MSTSDGKLHALYKRFDHAFPESESYERALVQIFEVIAQDLSQIRGSYMTKPFALHALCCAIYHNQVGLPGFAQLTGINPIGNALGCASDRATANLLELAAAHESKDSSRFPEYVDAMSAGSNREKQRRERIAILCRALRDQF